MPNHTKPKKKYTKWTKPLARKEAKKYTGKGAKSAFQKGSNGAYQYAKKHKLLSKICSHMTVLQTKWTKPLASKEAKRYTGKGARGRFQKGSPNAYRYAARNGLLAEICAHMPVAGTKWTKPLVTKEAKKYTGKGARTAFLKGSSGAYKYAMENGFLAEICAHMPKGRTKWTMPLLIKKAKEYQTRGAFQKGSRGAYLYALRNGLLPEICSHMHDARPADILKGIRNAVKGMKKKRAKK